MDEFPEFWVHECTVTPALAEGETDDYGRPLQGAPFKVVGWVEEGAHMVRDTTGVEVTAQATLTLPADATRIAVGSTLTLPTGRVAEVLTATWTDGRPLDLPSHAVYHTT